MNKYLVFVSSNIISGSMIYYVSSNLYKKYIDKKKEYKLPIDEYRYFVNK